jgi:hypothetical protein
VGETAKLYIIPLLAHEKVGVKIADICWGSCGKGLVGAINLDNETAEPWGTVPDGRDPERPVYLRKLKAPWRVIRPPWRERLRSTLRKIRYSPHRGWAALREWWAPTCKECGCPMKAHKPKVEPGGKVYFKREWGYGIDHIRACELADGVLFEVAAVHCTGEVDSVLMTYSDAEALRDALDEYLEKNK